MLGVRLVSRPRPKLITGLPEAITEPHDDQQGKRDKPNSIRYKHPEEISHHDQNEPGLTTLFVQGSVIRNATSTFWTSHCRAGG